MGVIDQIRGRPDSRHVAALANPDEPQPASPEAGAIEPKALDVETVPRTDTSGSDTRSLEARNEKEVEQHPDEVTQDAYLGVQKAEAAALVWGRKTIYALYAWIWVCFFMLAFHSSISSNVLVYAYAGFKTAPQISTASILGTIIGGVLKLPIAKLINIWGRAEGLMFFVAVYVLGIIIEAACNGPNGYAAGYVLYWIGYDAIYLILDVFIADTSGLINRAFAFAYASTPFIVTAFVGPLAAQSFIDTSGWRWSFGAFAIIQPFVFLPLAAVFKYYENKAIKLGVYKREPSGRTATQSLVHYIHEFDVVGALLLMAAFILFLLPFSLQQYGRAQYHSASFIAPVVIGFCLFFVFAAWEKWGTRVHFIRWELFKQRTVLGACGLAAISYFSFYSWDLYFLNFNMVVYDLNVSMAGYMGQIYNVGSCFWGVVFGIYVRITKHFKWACFGFGLPLLMLGAGLMIHFRGSEQGIGYIIMCQIFIAFGGGTLVIGEDMAVMAAADHDGVPLMLSLIGLASSVGGSVGYAVSAAIYANTFPEALQSALPASAQSDWNNIYLQGYTYQKTFPVGSDTRDAINYAWGQSQRNGAIAATAFLVLAFPCIAVWKDYNVAKKQVKGNVL
ncbi:major facilitator superfamily domain-containing protein [Phyllosticta citribraziliensis]|uniref:Major facilitator superfamily domain-containing protein n=1 Tax=Phyllosticta citribraziliensis TaxID=989973 RepID=A0ABR1M7I6_9PEZI